MMSKRKSGLQILADRFRQVEGDDTYAHIVLYTRDPNGLLIGSIGLFCWDYINMKLYVNDDGATSWTAIN